MKKNDTYGKILRKFIENQNKVNFAINPYVTALKSRSDYPDVITYLIFEALCNDATIKNFDEEAMDNDSINDRAHYLTANMAILAVFVNAYRILNLREKMDIINALDEALLAEMRAVKDLNDIIRVLKRDANISLIAEAVRFSDLSIYDKVLQMKALEESDVDFLMGIFPLFEDEYNHYNVEVNEAFMARQIKKWPAQFNGDVEKAYEDAARFLDKYSHYINKGLYERLVERTNCDEASDDMETMLKKFIRI